MSMIRLVLIAWGLLFFLVSSSHASDADAAVAILCPKHAELAPHIETAANINGGSPVLLTALIFRESSCDPTAVSKTGRVGLGQLTPWGPSANGLTRDGLKDPAKNANATARWFAVCLLQCAGNLRMALGAYHTGKCEDGEYTKRVMKLVAKIWHTMRGMAERKG